MEENNLKFRMRSRRFFLTYPQAPSGWTKEYVQDYILSRLSYRYHTKGIEVEQIGKTKVKSMIVGEEKHTNSDKKDNYDRGGKHYHCYVELKEVLEVKGANYFDIPIVFGSNELCHGDYRVVRDIWGSINYVKKECDYLEYGLLGVCNDTHQLLKANNKDALMIACDRTNNMKYKMDLRSQILLKSITFQHIVQVADQSKSFPFQKLFFPVFGKSGFFSGRPMGLILYGESGAGKTTFAYKIAKEWNSNIFIARSVERSFDTYDSESVILFDEMTKTEFEKETTQSFLADAITNVSAKGVAFHRSPILSWPRKLIITTNEDASDWYFSEALRSRFILIKVCADGSFQIQRFKNNTRSLINISVMDFTEWMNSRFLESEESLKEKKKSDYI